MDTGSVWKQRKWRLLVFRRAMVRLSAALVISALAAGLYRMRAYFAFAACAAGVLLLARAWWGYCGWRDHRPYRRDTGKVPYMLRKEKGKKPHKPAFLMNSADFDDDLNALTAVGEDGFSEDQCRIADISAAVLSGLLMIFFSAVL